MTHMSCRGSLDDRREITERESGEEEIYRKEPLASLSVQHVLNYYALMNHYMAQKKCLKRNALFPIMNRL